MQWKWKSGSSTLPVIQSSWCWPKEGSPLLLFHGSNIAASSCLVLWTGSCMPWCSTDHSLCTLANMHPVPGSWATVPNSLTDTDRASKERGGPRNWHQCLKKAKVNLWRWGSSEPALNRQLWKKLAQQQQLASLSNLLCTSLSTAKGLSDICGYS